MFGKQVYKGLMGRTVLGEETNEGSLSVTDARLYNKDELSQLFELEPHGVCKTIERLDLPSGGVQKGKCIVSKKHSSIVGLTRRSDIYKFKKRKTANEEEKEVEIEVEDEMPAVVGNAKKRKTDGDDEAEVPAAASKNDNNGAPVVTEENDDTPAVTTKEDEMPTETTKEDDLQQQPPLTTMTMTESTKNHEAPTDASTNQDDLESEAQASKDDESQAFVSFETSETSFDFGEVTQPVAI